MRIEALLQAATGQLLAAGIEDPNLDARLLLQYVTSLSRSQLVLRADDPLGAAVVEQYQQLIIQRCCRIPLQHLTGIQEFWSLELIVSPAVLIPRPETEFLLEQVLATVCRRPGQWILDMCTGSGAIALVLAQELACRVVAVDLSAQALVIAGRNRSKYRLESQVELIQSDLFSGLHPGHKYDCIVSNPPYIIDAVIDHLEPEVSLAEPRMALSGGEDGLVCIKRIIDAAPSYLRPGGWIFIEIGDDQKTAVEHLFHGAGRVYEQIRVVPDYAGRPRVARACVTGRD
ncbi:MAG: peptide chain release factor N(5)-glutamine methyltransferase [Desulfobulbus sp.]|nr:peptide chain release factor N(5)-glutamine methyltransferase [Desulfobulbus sp.]